MPTLYIAKGFDYAISHRFYREEWTHKENLDFFGEDTLGEFGHGHTHHTTFYFSGPSQSNGMICELSQLKTEVLTHLLSKLDHRFLNHIPDLVSQPSAVEIANYLLSQSQTHFKDWPLTVTMVSLFEDPCTTVYAGIDGTFEEIEFKIFNAPLLDEQTVYGTCTLKVRFKVDPDPELVLFQIHKKRNLTLQNWAKTKSEQYLAQPFIPLSLEAHLAQWWLELQPFTPFSVEAQWESHVAIQTQDHCFTGIKGFFLGSHCLEDVRLSMDQNKKEFGKCANHHGHTFYYSVLVQASSNNWDTISQIQQDIKAYFGTFSHRSFSHEEPRIALATCERLIERMYEELGKKITGLHTILLDETPRNRFVIGPTLFF